MAAKLSAMVGRAGGLSADQVADRAVQTSFSLKQRGLEVQAAVAGVRQALVAFLPRLTALGRYVRLSGIDPQLLGPVVVAPGSPVGPVAPGAPLYNTTVPLPVLLDVVTLQATLAIPLSDYLMRIPQSDAAARAARDGARLTERATRLQVAADARVAYYSWARARLQAVVAEQALLQAKTHRDAMHHLFEAGSTSKADTMRVEAQVAAAELFLERARDLETVLTEQLRTAMHDDSDTPFEIGEAVGTELPQLALEPLKQLVEEARAHRLEVRALDEARRAQQAQARVLRGAALPRLDAFGDLVEANPNPRFFPQQDSYQLTWDVGVQLSWTPNDTASNGFAAQGGDARALALAAQLGTLRDGLRGEVTQTYEAVREADFAVQSTGRGLEAAEESYRVRRELFQNGRSTSIEMTDAETELTQARLSAVGARIDQRTTRVRLQHALGRDVAAEEKR
jgi:outer membrane protein TolC